MYFYGALKENTYNTEINEVRLSQEPQIYRSTNIFR